MAEERPNSDFLEYINKLLDDRGYQQDVRTGTLGALTSKELFDLYGGGSVVELPPDLEEKKTLTDDELYEKIIKRFPETDPKFDRDYFFKTIKDRFLVKPDTDGIPPVRMPTIPETSDETLRSLEAIMDILRKKQSLERDPSGMTQLLKGD
tara:strand:+ start:343 stop:795 length:453 start_codon:yes stop_codon:yes gene_type:complete